MMDQKGQLHIKAELTTAYRDHNKSLNARAFFKTGSRVTGEDVVQETFMKTWTYLVKGGKIETMKAFLYHILNNLIVDEYRKRKTTSLDVMMEKGFDTSDENAERLVHTLDGKAALLLIQHLPQKYKEVMRMKYIQLMSLKEMALITGRPKNALAVQVHRGMKKLRLLYGSPKK